MAVIGTITHLFESPVKGLARLSKHSIGISTTTGVVGNHQFGIWRSSEPFDGRWHDKHSFYAGCNTQGIANIIPRFRNGDTADPEVRELDPACIGEIALKLGLEENGLTVVNTKGRFALGNTEGPIVSVGNMATIREIEKEAGVPGLFMHYRMDVYVDGLPPFVEYDWVGDGVEMGGLQFDAVDDCRRCRSATQSPQSGQWNATLLKPLMKVMAGRYYWSKDHKNPLVMGILLKPRAEGRLFINGHVARA